MNRLLCLICLLAVSSTGFTQQSALRQKIGKLISEHQATVGFALLDLATGDTLTFNGKKRMPMQSVYKLHLALTVLNQIDKGRFRMDQPFLLEKKDMRPDTWSPLVKKFPEGNIRIPLSQLLAYTVAQSDNVGCDLLFRLIGGPAAVDQYIKNLGIKEVSIVSTEAQMSVNDQLQFQNWTTPLAAVRLLKMFNDREILSSDSHAFLWKVMTASTTGKDKIQGLLPFDTPVAHKTGSSGVDREGNIAASNDIGIVTLPDGRKFAIAVFVSMTKEKEEVINGIIAELAKLSWDDIISK